MGKTRIKKRLTLSLKPSTMEKLKDYCERNSYARSNLIELIIDSWIDIALIIEERQKQYDVQQIQKLEIGLYARERLYDKSNNPDEKYIPAMDGIVTKMIYQFIETVFINLDESFINEGFQLTDMHISEDEAKRFSEQLESMKELVKKKRDTKS